MQYTNFLLATLATLVLAGDSNKKPCTDTQAVTTRVQHHNPPTYPRPTSTREEAGQQPPAYPHTTVQQLTTVINDPVYPTTTPVVLTTTPEVFVPPATTTPLAATTPVRQNPPANNHNGRYRCPGGRVPECCQTDVLDLASVTCDPPSRDPFNRRNFRAICAETGLTANCCLIPLLGQALLCQEV